MKNFFVFRIFVYKMRDEMGDEMGDEMRDEMRDER
jgi:hypothetical protein